MKQAVFVALLGLCGCASLSPAAPPPPEIIEYRTTPCGSGNCAVYNLVVSSDGVATFEGVRNTAIQGRRSFAIRPQEFEYFQAALDPYRPEGQVIHGATADTCQGSLADNAPGVQIRWSDKDRDDSLVAYFGCNLEANRAMYQALADAPDTLPLKLFLGR